MPDLNDLPIELLGEILSHLDITDLCNTSLVSRLFNSVGVPLLYKVAEIGRNDTPTSITYFLRTILARPILATYVRALYLNWVDDLALQPSCDTRLFDTVAEGLGLPKSPWSEETQALLLLHILPNLQELSIASSPVLQEFLKDTLTLPIGSLPLGLKSLVTFHDWGSCEPARVTPKMLLAILRLPFIHEVNVDMQFDDDDRDDCYDPLETASYHRKSSVTKLCLKYGDLSVDVLRNILHVPRALTHFSYSDFSDCDTIGPSATTFQMVLNHLRPTLQSLHLGWISVLEEDDGEAHTIGSLREWPVLRTVDCCLAALVGKPAVSTSRLVDVLPVVIRDLTIHRQDEVYFTTEKYQKEKEWTVLDMTDQVVELLKRKNERGLSELTQLTVGAGFWVTGVLPEDQPELEAKLKITLDACAGSVCVSVI